MLGSLLASDEDPEIAMLVRETPLEAFYSLKHRRIYQAIKQLWEIGHAANIITVSDWLKDKDFLEEAGGASYVSSLLNLGSIPSQAGQYLAILSRDSLKRSLIEIGLNLVDGSKNGREPEDLIKEGCGRLEGLLKNIPGKTGDIMPHLEGWNDIKGLDIKVEWIIDRLIPKESITIIFGKGGIGKTWLTLDMARCVGNGMPFLGLSTIKTPVIFIDFENPLAALNARLQKLGDAEGVYFWRAHNDKLKAPKLDSKEWEEYKGLPQGAILIFDTLRSSQGKDENASNDMAIILGRVKELRDMGFTIILLHHTAKNSDRAAKGSTAIVDLADHILGLVKVKKRADGQDEALEDEDNEEDVVYRFGVREKTRFDPCHIYLTLNPDRGFELAPDPQEETLKKMHKILTGYGTLTKTAFAENCKGLNIGINKSRKLIEVGQGRYWMVKKGDKHTYIIEPIQLVNFTPLYKGVDLTDYKDAPAIGPVELDNPNCPKPVDNPSSVNFREGFCTINQLNLKELLI